MTKPHFPLPFEENEIVEFSSEEVEFELENKQAVIEWLKKIIEQSGNSLRLLNFIFWAYKNIRSDIARMHPFRFK